MSPIIVIPIHAFLLGLCCAAAPLCWLLARSCERLGHSCERVAFWQRRAVEENRRADRILGAWRSGNRAIAAKLEMDYDAMIRKVKADDGGCNSSGGDA
jgi:hypothetical protein